MEKKLVNFRVPKSLADGFDMCCEAIGHSRTEMLHCLMREFVLKEQSSPMSIANYYKGLGKQSAQWEVGPGNETDEGQEVEMQPIFFSAEETDDLDDWPRALNNF